MSRLAVVTGARQGLGRVIARQLAARGYRLALLDIVAPTETAQEVGGVPVEVDVADEAGVRAAADRLGPVDVLVNNAGISHIAPAEDTTAEQWRRVLEVNLTGPFLLCQAFGRGMLDRRSGSIVNVASIAGLRGVADRAAYNASKHGLIGLTRTLAVEWGGRGVRVNAVCPGWIKTEMDVADQGSGAYSDEDIVEHVPMGRFARPEDVAQAVAFLADDDASGFVNGQELGVDGGWHADGSWQRLRLSKR
ncbi:MAG TPA: SDR family oxidoreductase [Mycobacteriales bacterium]|nr:SDR family oxidoreductase [Mycobacteriales bacterium]